MFFYPESFSLIHLTSGLINYVQSESKGAEPTVDQLTISVSDGVHRSAPVPFYIIINPTNDETPSLLLANFTVSSLYEQLFLFLHETPLSCSLLTHFSASCR